MGRWLSIIITVDNVDTHTSRSLHLVTWYLVLVITNLSFEIRSRNRCKIHRRRATLEIWSPDHNPKCEYYYRLIKNDRFAFVFFGILFIRT